MISTEISICETYCGFTIIKGDMVATSARPSLRTAERMTGRHGVDGSDQWPVPDALQVRPGKAFIITVFALSVAVKAQVGRTR